MKPELIVALDVPSTDKMKAVVERIPSAVTWYKIGLELFTAQGPEAISFLLNMGKKVFLDLKLHDIPRTVARAIVSAAGHGVSMLTVHAGGGEAMLKAAAEAVSPLDARPLLVAVTTLTSLDQRDLNGLGVARPLEEHTRTLGALARNAGIDGLVCSPLEVAMFREVLDPAAILVTPGVRLPDDRMGDQKRVATPADAVRAGANFLVVGRPIVEASNPSAAAERILQDMATAS